MSYFSARFGVKPCHGATVKDAFGHAFRGQSFGSLQRVDRLAGALITLESNGWRYRDAAAILGVKPSYLKRVVEQASHVLPENPYAARERKTAPKEGRVRVDLATLPEDLARLAAGLGPGQRPLFVTLAEALGTEVPKDELIARMWRDRTPPAKPSLAVNCALGRLRPIIEQRGLQIACGASGYVLRRT